MNLRGKRVLVTGGAIRIGRELCLRFAEKGCEVIIHCNNSVNEAKMLCKKLKQISELEHKYIVGDLRDCKFCNKMIKQFSPLHILINNASIFRNMPIMKEKEEEAKQQFEINFFAPLRLMKAFIGQNTIIEGVIINILDQRIAYVNIDSGSYILSKKALKEVTLMLAYSVGKRIRVNGIAPGVVLPPKDKPHFSMQKVIKTVPTKLPVNAEHIADACIFLAENNSINGEILFIDGGQHIKPYG